MAKVAFVACAKTKASKPGPAAAVYVSALYRKSLLAALDCAKSVYIISAKHGLLDLSDRIAPYEQTLKAMTATERADWGERVGAAMAKCLRAGDQAVFFSGDAYLAPLRMAVRRLGCSIELPLGSRSLGNRLKKLRELNGEADLERMLPRFMALMLRLERAQQGGRLLSDCSGRLPWPDRGVYFILEDTNAQRRRRITRVGTHAVSLGSRTTLWDRISTHRGANHGGGSHRSSIFRSHVGRALLRRGDLGTSGPTTWGVGQSAPADIRSGELDLERRVSDVIGAMRVLWLDIGDEAGPRSDRAYLERNIIGLLSRTNLLGLDRGIGDGWLGQLSDEWRIAASGLWNLDHLFFRPDPKFLDVLESYVDTTIGKGRRPCASIAPAGWGRSAPEASQLSLFQEMPV